MGIFPFSELFLPHHRPEIPHILGLIQKKQKTWTESEGWRLWAVGPGIRTGLLLCWAGAAPTARES